METAALISIYSGYIALSFLPPLVWLLFYLHEDRHPEPKRLILLTFISGIAIALLAIIVELFFLGKPPIFRGVFYTFLPWALEMPVIVLFGIALIEEYLKYLSVKLAVFRRPEFDEPVDAMVYMITAALGFAAMENVLFLIPRFEESLAGGFGLTASRFFGANLLHALSSAIVGYAIAKHFFSPWRKHAIFFGIAVATLLHALFNYLIITKDVLPESLVLVVFLLALMAAVVFADFERLKRQKSIPNGSA